MRDVDFLPSWYPAIQRRHQMVVLQVWATAIVIVALISYAGAKRWEVHSAQRATALIEAQVRLSKQQLAQLSQKMEYEHQLKRQDDIVAKLGLNVDASRMLAVMEESMTPDMVLTDVSMETVETPVQVSLTAPNRRRGSGDAPATDIDRRLMVKMTGFAPNDSDTAVMMGRLNDVKFLENLALGPIQDGRTQDGHVVSEFEVTFEVNLNSPEVK